MSNEITRENVQKILDGNKAKHKEAKLDRIEQNMISACNRNCADAKKRRQQEDTAKLKRQRDAMTAIERQEAARQEARARDQVREEAATLAVRRYIIACGGIVLATLLTPFEWWAAAALILGLAAFPAARVYRLYWLGVAA